MSTLNYFHVGLSTCLRKEQKLDWRSYDIDSNSRIYYLEKTDDESNFGNLKDIESDKLRKERQNCNGSNIIMIDY